MPAASPGVQPRTASRIVIALLAILLLAGLHGPDDAQALTPLGNQISSGRRSQAYFESVMLAQDAAISRLKVQSKLTHRAYKQSRKALTRNGRAYRGRVRIVNARRARLSEAEAKHKDTPPEELPDWYLERVRSLRRDLAKAVRHRAAAARQLRASQRVSKARRARLGALKRLRRAAVGRREAAEGGLGAYIISTTRLAQRRAELMTGTRSVLGGSSFSWPAVGRLSQTYGCTGFYLNPRRGSCRHFHDGLDIVAGYGSPVRTAADGVVAFAGWNPWDEGGRAWIMVVSHPGGYVTRYGHLLPGGRARVGQFVRRGQAIGRMGNTGKSLGTHLHFELLRSSSPLNPWSYLPAGMVNPRVSRGPGHRAGKATSRRHRAGHHKGRAERRERRQERRRDRREARADARHRAEALERAGMTAQSGLADSASALVESSLDDATTLLCEALEQADRVDGDDAAGDLPPTLVQPRADAPADEARSRQPDDPCGLVEARSTDSGVAAASSRRSLSAVPIVGSLEPVAGAATEGSPTRS